MGFDLNSEVQTLLEAIKLKERIDDLYVYFKLRKAHDGNVLMARVFASYKAKKGSQEKRLIWELNQHPNLIPISNRYDRLRSDVKTIEDATIGLYFGTPLWDDVRTTIDGGKPFDFISELRKIEMELSKEGCRFNRWKEDHIKEVAEEAKSMIAKMDNTRSLIACLGTIRALLGKLHTKNLRQYAALCSGTLQEQKYTRELAELKELTQKILNYSPKLADFAKLIADKRNEIDATYELIAPEASAYWSPDDRIWSINNYVDLHFSQALFNKLYNRGNSTT